MPKKSIFEDYEKLIADSALFGGIDKSVQTRYDPNDDESEGFMTDDELEKINHPQDDNGESRPPLPNGPREIEETVHFKRYTTRREHKYTEKELADIRESCISSIVHDYGENDEYHMSDEERARIDSLNEIRMRLNGVTKLYRRIDKYIEAMRVVVEAWELLEKKDNYLHTKDEFFKLVAAGKIYNNSIIMPKMKGLDKYNLDLVIRYISNPELDPTDLVPVDPVKKIEDEWYKQFEDSEDDETEEEEMERLLSPDEVQYILDNIEDPPMIEVHDIKKKYIKGYDQKTYGGKKKKMSKKMKRMRESLHPMLQKIQNNPANRDGFMNGNRSYLITTSMFEQPTAVPDFWDGLRYEGSWTDDASLFFYDLAVNEEILKQHPVGNKYESYADVELNNFFRTMEQNGMNVVELRRRMNMTDEASRIKTIKKMRKDNKKRESALLQRITKLNNNPKFKKLINKAEKAANEGIKDY